MAGNPFTSLIFRVITSVDILEISAT